MASEPLRFGPHTLRREADILVLRMNGPFTLEDATQFYAFVEQVHAEHGRCFLLADVAALDNIEMEARRYVARRAEGHIEAVAAYGANPVIRTVAELLFSAIRLMRKRTSAQLAFVKDEAEGRRWLAERRAHAGEP